MSEAGELLVLKHKSLELLKFFVHHKFGLNCAYVRTLNAYKLSHFLVFYLPTKQFSFRMKCVTTNNPWKLLIILEKSSIKEDKKRLLELFFEELNSAFRKPAFAKRLNFSIDE